MNNMMKFVLLSNEAMYKKEDIIETIKGFITEWETDADLKVKIPTNSDYTYDYEIDWGDGSKESFTGDAEHTYTEAGNYDVEITGIFPSLYINNFSNKTKLLSIKAWGNIIWETMYKSFYGASNVEHYATDTPNTSAVEDLRYAFNSCKTLTKLNIKNWDLSSLTKIRSFLSYSDKFNDEIYIDAPNLTDIAYAFTYCYNLNSNITIKSNSLTNADYAFQYCGKLNSNVNIDLDNVISTKYMFKGCSEFNKEINLNMSENTDMTEMYSGCKKLNSPITILGAKIKTIEKAFYDCQLLNKPVYIASNALENAKTAFSRCYVMNSDIELVTSASLKYLDSFLERNYEFNANLTISNTDSVSSTRFMFYMDSKFNKELSFDLPALNNAGYMFEGCSSLNSPVEISSTTLTFLYNMFKDCSVFNQEINYDLSNTLYIRNMFQGCSAFDIDLSLLDYSNISSFDNYVSDTVLSVSNYDALLNKFVQDDVGTDKTFTANGLTYSNDGDTARQDLIDNYGWTISGDNIEAS